MPRPLNSDEIPAPYIERYIQAIKSCFATNTVISPYFYQLIDYIESEARHGYHMNPIPTAIRIRGSSDPATQSQADGRTLKQPWGFDVPETDVDRSQTPCLLTIEGLPSPGCVAYIGSRYRLRPEYWLGNLSFDRQNPTQCYFELPNLPSRRDNVVQVSIPALGRRTGSSSSTPRHLSAKERRDAKEKLEEWDGQLFPLKKFGATRIRRLHLHDSDFFSIEQLVSFSVCVRSPDVWIGKRQHFRMHGWKKQIANCGAGIFLVDQGLEVPETNSTPWSNYTRLGRAPDCLPILMYNESPSGYAMPSTPRASNPTTPNPFHPKDHVRVANDEELALLRKSPFAVLANVLARAASAWAHMLNLIDSDIDKCKTRAASTAAEALGLALEQLRFNFDFLAHAKQCLNDNIYLIDSRGCQGWPGHQEYETGSLGARLVASLRVDHTYLVNRSSELSRRCETVSQVLADTLKMIETSDSLDQTKRLNNLTVLAFIFVPVGFVSTFFGMNVDVFADNPSIWIYFAVAVPTAGLVFLSLYLFPKGIDKWV